MPKKKTISSVKKLMSEDNITVINLRKASMWTSMKILTNLSATTTRSTLRVAYTKIIVTWSLTRHTSCNLIMVRRLGARGAS